MSAQRHAAYGDSQPRTRITARLTAKIPILLALLAAAACQSETTVGKCVGFNGHEDSTLVYEYSARNVFWGVFGVEIIYPPIKVALDELKCPVAKRRASAFPATDGEGR